VGWMRSPIIRSTVDLPHPDGPISDTNSPGSMARSMSWSATTLPCANCFVSFWISTTLISQPPVGHSRDVLRGAPHDDLLGADDDEEERDAEQSRDDVRRPEVLRAEGVVLVEVD